MARWWMGGLAVLLVWSACGGRARYIMGQPPLGAAPEPIVTTVEYPKGEPPRTIEGMVTGEGVVKRLRPGTRPGFGFKMEMETADQKTLVIEVRDFADHVPDIVPGASVKLRVFRAEGLFAGLHDVEGPLFYLFAGANPPADHKGIPIGVTASSRRVYTETKATPDLCRKSIAHDALLVRTKEGNMYLPPGAKRVVETQGRHYLVAAVDAREVEETDCPAQEPGHVSFFWMRLPAREGKALLDRQQKGLPID